MAGSEVCWCGDMLSDIASLVTILSLIITPVFFFFKRWYDKVSERRMASKNLHGELEDALHALDEKRHPDYFLTLQFSNGSKVQYMNRSLNHDVYDSLIFSGRINFLRHSLQQQIQDVFRSIKIHNEYTAKVGEMLDRGRTDEDVYAYYVRLGETEKRLLAAIPGTMEKLASDTKIN